jgi:hypothetical protein
MTNLAKSSALGIRQAIYHDLFTYSYLVALHFMFCLLQSGTEPNCAQQH